jgi:hypothetical protein
VKFTRPAASQRGSPKGKLLRHAISSPACRHDPDPPCLTHRGPGCSHRPRFPGTPHAAATSMAPAAGGSERKSKQLAEASRRVVEDARARVEKGRQRLDRARNRLRSCGCGVLCGIGSGSAELKVSGDADRNPRGSCGRPSRPPLVFGCRRLHG